MGTAFKIHHKSSCMDAPLGHNLAPNPNLPHSLLCCDQIQSKKAFVKISSNYILISNLSVGPAERTGAQQPGASWRGRGGVSHPARRVRQPQRQADWTPSGHPRDRARTCLLLFDSLQPLQVRPSDPDSKGSYQSITLSRLI